MLILRMNSGMRSGSRKEITFNSADDFGERFSDGKEVEEDILSGGLDIAWMSLCMGERLTRCRLLIEL